jgi:glycosyltransferase involved in cell wall biosynthesis
LLILHAHCTKDFGAIARRHVIAYAAGGATETIVPGETGVFFYEQTWESLLHAVLHFNADGWDSARIRDHAQKFSATNFKTMIKKYVEDHYEEFSKKLNQTTLV